jgi:hypothetical protein
MPNNFMKVEEIKDQCHARFGWLRDPATLPLVFKMETHFLNEPMSRL